MALGHLNFCCLEKQCGRWDSLWGSAADRPSPACVCSQRSLVLCFCVPCAVYGDAHGITTYQPSLPSRCLQNIRKGRHTRLEARSARHSVPCWVSRTTVSGAALLSSLDEALFSSSLLCDPMNILFNMSHVKLGLFSPGISALFLKT